MKNHFKHSMLNGIRAIFYNSKFMLLHFFTNAAFAIILSGSLYYILANSLSHSVISSDLTLTIDYVWYTQFREFFKENLGELPYTIYSVVGIYGLIQTFYLGGLISVFHQPKKNHFVDFFYGCVKYWYRFTKVTLVSLLFYALAFLINDYLGDLIRWIFHRTEFIYADTILRSLRYLILLFLIGMVSLISDYTKVILAVEDELKMWRGVYKTLLFVKNNFSVVFGIFLLISVLGASGAVIYNLVGTLIPKAPVYYLILVFFLQQMLIIFRLYIRMYFYATEVYLYKDISAEIIVNN